ncbi:MAG: hypothetical protein WCJ37_10035 [Syntrophus sp. (in: bacteria)]
MENQQREEFRPIDEADKLTCEFMSFPWREWSEDDGNKATLD